ncbi:MAG: bifunctional phosphopantothenoylcysteine decarboxylase/phosphopantothenate--cysteine ligase CoaBC [Mycobacteriales bacterium]
MSDASRPKIVLGVGGGIAAYKAAELLRLLTRTHRSVRVIPTEAALRFVGAPTWAALSGLPVSTEVWDDVDQIAHVSIGRYAELILVAPATADLLARAATGRADDLLTATLLTARCPVLDAPAMHTEMWEHPATRANVATLRARGAVVLEPATGRLTGDESGVGRLPEPVAIAAAADRILRDSAGTREPALAGRHVVVAAGGTREYLDPVRFLANASSGKQGYAIAATAAARGARVTLIAANVSLPDPAGVTIERVTTTGELHAAVRRAAGDADVVVMAAAPADFGPARYAEQKIKKTRDRPAPVELVALPDIAAGLGAARAAGELPAGQVLVTFAAETSDRDTALAAAAEKLRRKQAHLSVLNIVAGGAVFGADDTAATVLSAEGDTIDVPPGSKDDLAAALLDLVGTRLAGDTRTGR